MTERKTRQRIWYWDILRIAAVLCLVVRHISTASFDFVPALGPKWWVFNCYGSLVAWMVPVYLMLSGASFLDPAKPLTIKTLYTRNIWHMVVAFFAWSAASWAAFASFAASSASSQPVSTQGSV